MPPVNVQQRNFLGNIVAAAKFPSGKISCDTGVALLRYFKPNGDTGAMLPDPRGPLAKQVPSTSITSASEEVKDVLAQGTEPTKRGAYAKFTPAQKAGIGKRAAEHGVAATVRYFEKKYPGLKESSVRTWKKTYTSEIAKRRREGSQDFTVKYPLENWNYAIGVVNGYSYREILCKPDSRKICAWKI